MKQEALDELDYDAFALAVRDVLESEPEGLRITKLYERLAEEHEVPPRMYFPAQLAELSRGGDVVIDHQNSCYLHPDHADKGPDEYRPTIGKRS